MGVTMAVPMRMPVIVRMTMGLILMMGVGRGGNHDETL